MLGYARACGVMVNLDNNTYKYLGVHNNWGLGNMAHILMEIDNERLKVPIYACMIELDGMKGVLDTEELVVSWRCVLLTFLRMDVGGGGWRGC
jgi:hypothetical protein